MDWNLYSLLFGVFVGFAVEFAFDFFVTRKKRSEGDDTVSSAQLDKAEAELKDLRVQVASIGPMRNQIAAKQVQINELTARLESSSPNGQTFEAAKEIQAQYEAELAKAANEIRAQEAEIARLKESLDEGHQGNAAVAQEIDALKLELANNEETIHGLEARIFEAQGVHGQEIQNLKETISQYNLDLARTQAEIQGREEQIQELEERAAHMAMLEAQIEELSQRHSETEHYVLDLQSKSAAKDDHINELENRLREFQLELSTAKQDLVEAEQAREALLDLEGRFADQEREIVELRTRHSEVAIGQTGDLAAELKAQTARADALERDVESLKAVSASKDQAIAESRAAANQAESQLAFRPAAEEVAKLKEELVQKEAQIQELMSQSNQPLRVAQSANTDGQAGSRPYATGASRDPFIQISGIGHLYERKLWEAGVLTFSDLASSTPEQIYEIIQPAEWQRIEPETWILEASQMEREAAS